MLRFVLIAGVLTVLSGCKSYELEWTNTRQQLLAAEAEIQTLRNEIKSRDESIAVRDEAIVERDSIIRDRCYAKPQPER